MGRLRASVLAVALLWGGVAQAADEAPPAQPLVQPLTPPPAEETPGFQAIRPVLEAAPDAAAAPSAAPPAPPAVAPSAPPPPPPPPAPAPVRAPTAAEPVSLPAGLLPALALVVGGLIAALAGLLAVASIKNGESRRQRLSTARMLALELEARRQAFEAVPIPPNADAGVSFVSAVVALARQDHAWQAAQTSLYLLPEGLAGHLQVHYAAVHHVADFMKGQAIAAGLRMLQANRMGGHPSPDAAAMRDAHVELVAAFRGVDKIVIALKAV